MSICTLGPNATTAEIEDEIVFYDVMLDTLDPESDEYEVQKQQYEATLSDLEQRLENQRSTPGGSNRPLTPIGQQLQDTNDLHSQSSIDLPSREPPVAPRPQGYAASPLQGRSSWNWPESTSATAGPSQQKRNADNLHARNDMHKKARTDGGTPSTTDSRASTPSPPGYLEPVARDIKKQQRVNPVRYNILAKLQEQQRQHEARIKAEQDDLEFARSLSFDGSDWSTPVASATARNTQSFFRPDGQFSRPTPSSSSQTANRPAFGQHGFGGQPKTETQQQYNEPAKASFAAYSQQPASFDQPGSKGKVPIISLEDDDDIQYLGNTNAGLGSSVSNQWPTTLQPEQSPSPYGSAAAIYMAQQMRKLGNNTGNALGNSVYTTLQNPVGGFNSSTTLNGFNQSMPGTGVYNTTMDNLQASSAYHQNSSLNAYGSMATNPIDLDFLSGLPPVRSYSPGLFNIFGDGSTDAEWGEYMPRGMPSLESQLQARGLDYMLNDPAQTREDLEKLIENIRPDEDLPPEMRVDSPEQLRVNLMKHQKLGLTWMQKQEDSSAKGGILADDMGLGKTIQALALIATRQSDNLARKTTLVIAPVALLRQWKREIEERIAPRHRLTCMIYHGQVGKRATFSKLSQYDIVITTFGKLASEVKRKWKFDNRRRTNPDAVRRSDENLLLLDERSKFHRIIVDEAQNIKNHNAQSSTGALFIDATYRWCMTGTPMMNNVGELFSLVRFLRIPPYNQKERFNSTFKKPLEGTDDRLRNRAMTALQALCKSIMLRRTKDSKIDGEPILKLPERTTEVAHAVFDEEQEKFYRALEHQTQLLMSKWLEKGKALKNYSYILVRLLRLRQACDHPHLIKDYSENAYADVSKEDMAELSKQLAPEVVERIKEAKGAFECPICYDAVENPSIFFPCGHDCCPECFAKVTDPSINEDQSGARCPECRNPLNTKQIIDYRSFKKVHMPDDEADADEDNLHELLGLSKDGDSDSDESDSDDDEDDEDSQGDLDGFIVDDDEPIEEEEDEDSETEDERVEESKPSIEMAKDGYMDETDGKSNEDTRNTGLEAEAEVSEDEEPSRKGKSRVSKGKEPVTSSKSKGKQPRKKKAKAKKTKMSLAELKKASTKNVKAKKRYLRRLQKNFMTSAKIEKTEQLIHSIIANDPAEKIIIFSQFTTFLDLLEIPISRENWNYRRFDGAMSAKDRNEAVMDFQDMKKGVKIILVSLKAGNAGLNLTAASQVLILDPFWNPFIEEQAIDRAHRIGQHRPVHVHRILIKNTVEDRIVALQDQKRELINTALDENASRNLSRLGRAELRYLFGLDQTMP